MLGMRGAAWAVSRGVLASALLAVVAGATVFACGQGAVGVDACLQIEHARCGWVVACHIPLPTPRSESASPVDACDRYYADQCLHGLVTTVQPDKTKVQACVDAINTASDCTIVDAPETSEACAFLIPPDGGLDAADGE